MDPALVEELEAINKVKTTLNHIGSARAKRVEIRHELEGLGYDYRNIWHAKTRCSWYSYCYTCI